MIVTLNQISRSVTRPRVGGGIVDTVCGQVIHSIRATTNDVSELEAMAVGQYVTLVQQGYDFVLSDDPNDNGPKGYITEYTLNPSLGPNQSSIITFSAIFDVQKENREIFEAIDIEGIRIENKSW